METSQPLKSILPAVRKVKVSMEVKLMCTRYLLVDAFAYAGTEKRPFLFNSINYCSVLGLCKIMYKNYKLLKINKCGMANGFLTNHSYLGDISKMAEQSRFLSLMWLAIGS